MLNNLKHVFPAIKFFQASEKLILIDFPWREESKKEEPDTPRYRDRAKERREDQNPDYEPTELGSFHAVAPPGADLR